MFKTKTTAFWLMLKKTAEMVARGIRSFFLLNSQYESIYCQHCIINSEPCVVSWYYWSNSSALIFISIFPVSTQTTIPFPMPVVPPTTMTQCAFASGRSVWNRGSTPSVSFMFMFWNTLRSETNIKRRQRTICTRQGNPHFFFINRSPKHKERIFSN